MAANSTNREAARDALADLWRAATVPTYMQAVFGSIVADPGGKWPFGAVDSVGTWRQQKALGALAHANRFKLLVATFVLAASAERNWTDGQASDQLDLLDKLVADVLADNRGKKQNPAVPWDYIGLEDGFSEQAPARAGNEACWMETRFVIVEMKDA